ncbi:hypothetical protein [Acidovorax sp. CCYZU-2555]|uniref:hypothetical protein n=1 Tax=Acidovorax sp. CCYZU-2555 TaxID=2835042 RepID=UPI001BD0120E|nr:hypothetical protein [Acidovorax sp. CCYZU-2555]MBS7777077.1 hypothetical protein [Acidovorax sp. CCYZU-2555]
MRPKVHFKHKEFYFEFNCNFICVKAQITRPGSQRQFTCALLPLMKMGNSPATNNYNNPIKMLDGSLYRALSPASGDAPIIAE